MYDINGDFGKVRIIQIPVGHPSLDVPFLFLHGGWHCCNETYRVNRNNGLNAHLLLFSVNNGGMLEMNGQKAVSIPASSVTWIPKGCRHSYYTKTGQLWELYWLHVEENPFLNLEQAFNHKNCLQIPNINLITNELEALLQNRKLTGSTFSIETSRAIGNIYHTILLASYMQKEKHHKKDLLVASIIKDMEAACEKDWKLPELSQQYFISVPQLIRRFKKATDLSPHAYLVAIRLQRVCEYLQYTSLSVDEISKKIGFSSTSNMITQFRNTYGITPGKYRENKM